MKLGAHAFTLRQLQYLVAVADAGSFRRAAEHCFVSQPSLSAQIAELERALGLQLLERDRRSVRATVAGTELVERARRILLDVDDLTSAVQRHMDPLAGTLRLGVIPTLGPYLLPDLDPALRFAFPELKLRWVEEKTEVLIQRMERGEIDAALMAMDADLGEMEHATIGHDPFVLATPPNHPLARPRRAVGIDELQGEPVLLLDEGHCLRNQALDLCARAGTQELGFRATSLATLSQMVAGGSGITLLPQLAVDVENRRGLLAIRRFKAPAPNRTIVLAWRRRSALAASLQKLADTARAAFPDGRAA